MTAPESDRHGRSRVADELRCSTVLSFGILDCTVRGSLDEAGAGPDTVAPLADLHIPFPLSPCLKGARRTWRSQGHCMALLRCHHGGQRFVLSGVLDVVDVELPFCVASHRVQAWSEAAHGDRSWMQGSNSGQSCS